MPLDKSPAYLKNKQNEIKTIIDQCKPHVFGLSEANFKLNHDKEDVRIEDYEVYFSKTLNNSNLNISRIAVYVQTEISSKIRLDLMNDSFSSIWLELGLPRQKKILVCQVYRDWQFLDQSDHSSLSIESQLARWIQFIDQWETALLEGKEVIVLGDVNVDFLTWTNEFPANSHDQKLKPLINQIFDRIFPHGVSQCVSVPTRNWPGQEPSGLDHFYTNRPEKLSEVQAIYQGGSDHKLIIATRFSKAAIEKPRIIKKRVYKHFDPLTFIAAVRSLSWEDV